MKPEFRKVTDGLIVNMNHVVMVIDRSTEIELHMMTKNKLTIYDDDAAKFRAYMERQTTRG